ncbi:zinc-binding dehydrogenase [Baekduia soli]|uniref:Zinc-binding dehydrogenase n=1 Tax=Baekduia soli TaxID=496014 RepID=A0A5B8U8K0_9ACTN|nr:alcohol dehydrogenase catalytic domain-containing protein [Baekduia soli]QEC49310.1 zinc-binding dehydrogenase [Baekduia soli]
MRAVVVDAFGAPPSVREVPDPEPPPGGALVEVRATGLCRSDWHGWMGHDPAIRLPHIPGHEFAGVVVAVGAGVRDVAPGDRVTAPFCCGCGRCEPCRQGHTQLCDVDHQPGFSAPGTFARLVAIPVADLNVVALPDDVAFADVAALGCRFMTAHAAVTVRGRVAAGEWVAVHGCGGVGLSAVMLATALGAGVVAADVDPRALELARGLGAVHLLDARDGDVADRVRELTGGGAHASIDAVGSAATCAASVLGLRKRGRHLQVGLLTGAEAAPPVPMAAVIARELEVLGVHGMAVDRYPELLALVASGAVAPGRLVRRRIGLDAAPAALAAMGTAEAAAGITVIDGP